MIEKNIRLQPHHARDLLVGRRSDGRRPGYQPPGYSGPSGQETRGDTRGADPSPGGGGNGRSAALAAQAAAAANRAAANRAAEQKAAAERAMQATIAQAEAERQEVERMNQLAEARKLMTQPTTVDVPIKGPELIPGTTHPFTVDPYQQNYISPGQVRTTGIYNEGDYDKLVEGPIDVGFQEALRKQEIAEDLRQKQQDPDYGQFFRPQPVVEKPKTGIGGALKTAGKGILETALMPFLPKPVRTAWQAKKRYDALQKSAIGEKLNLKELDFSNLKSTIKKATDRRSRPSDMPEHLGERGFRTRRETPEGGEGGDIQTAITGEDVISESIKKYTSLTDDQVNYIRAQLKGRDPEELRSILAQAKSRIESGEANQMEKDVFALVQEYLVDPTQYTAQGGRIDSPLMGGNRYI